MDIIKKIKNYSYNERHCLGEGSFGKVYEGKSDDGHTVAIKKIDKAVVSNDEYLKSALQTQIMIMKKLHHPNIVSLEDVSITANNIYLIVQFCSGGDLRRYCKNRKLTEQQAIKIIKQIIKGFQQMVRHGIIHRDLKPANVLIHEGVFKICDFGFAKFFSEANMSKTCVGTPSYMSPQVLSQNHYTQKTDIWSLGILFYELLFSKLPFRAGSEKQLHKLLVSHPINIPSCSTFSENFIKGTLQVQQQNRWNWKQIFDYFGLQQQPFIQKKQSIPESMFYNKKINEDTFKIEQKKQTYQRMLDGSVTQNYKRRQETHKPKPRNILAYQNIQPTIQNNSIKNIPNTQVLQDNPRALYFMLAQMLIKPIQSQTFKEFLVSFFKHTVKSYQTRIVMIKQRQQDIQYKILMSELNYIKSLAVQIPKIRVEEDSRKLAQKLKKQLEGIDNWRENRQMLQKFIKYEFKYLPK